jgi:hypothetical protein
MRLPLRLMGSEGRLQGFKQRAMARLAVGIDLANTVRPSCRSFRSKCIACILLGTGTATSSFR